MYEVGADNLSIRSTMLSLGWTTWAEVDQDHEVDPTRAQTATRHPPQICEILRPCQASTGLEIRSRYVNMGLEMRGTSATVMTGAGHSNHAPWLCSACALQELTAICAHRQMGLL